MKLKFPHPFIIFHISLALLIGNSCISSAQTASDEGVFKKIYEEALVRGEGD
jgi:hypothetical protein